MHIPFQVTDWNETPATRHVGERGEALWKTLQYEDLRIREVKYSAGYIANHWCSKGHIIYCIEGEMTTELSDGRTFTLKPGMSYQVSDNLSLHRSVTETGVKLLIIDGGFLKRDKGLWI